MNTNNILKFGYEKNLKNNITQFFRNMKFAYQRITKGYCDVDLYSLDMYYIKLFCSTLREFGSRTHTWPSTKFEKFEDWQKYLEEISKHFENSLEETNSEFREQADEAYEKMIHYETEYMPQTKNLTEYKSLVDDWLKKERKTSQFRETEKDIAFDMLKEVFFSLWD